MRCFVHHDREAIGSCKACAKGLCEECVVDLGHGLSCRGAHEEIVQTHRNVFEYSSRAISQAKNAYITPAFFAVMGAIFVWFGYDRFEGRPFNLPTIMGGAFVIYAAIFFVRARMLVSTQRA